MKSTFNIILLVLIVSLAGCRKGRHEFTIKGQINDSTFGQLLLNCQISLYEVEAGAADSILIDSFTSTDGTYSFTFERKRMEEYILYVNKTGYFPLAKHIPFGDLTTKEDNIYNYVTNAKSWVQLHFVNINPQPFDQLNFIKQAGKVDCAECCPTTEQYIINTPDTSIYCINDGNTTYSLVWYDPVNGVNGVESVVTVAFDTTELLVTY